MLYLIGQGQCPEDIVDVFDLRQQLIRDYAEYVSSFLEIADERVREHLNERLADGLLWPHPLVQLNPAFEPAETIDDLMSLAELTNYHG